MKTFRHLFAGILLAIAVFAPAQGEDPALRKEIQAVYAKWDALCNKLDIKSAMAMFDPSSVQIDKDGKRMTFAQMKAMMASIFKNVKDCKCQSKVEQVQGGGHEANAWISFSVAGLMKQGSKWASFSCKAKNVETLKKTANGWVFTMSQDLP